jgi:hypothetical protein
MSDRAKFATLADLDCGELLAKLFGGAATKVRAAHVKEPGLMRVVRFYIEHPITLLTLLRGDEKALLADINTPFSYYGPTVPNMLVTPLMWACIEKNVRLVRVLLDLGANPNFATGKSLAKCPSAFHLACNGEILGDYCAPLLSELLKTGAPEMVRWEDDNATSLLHYTVMAARTDPVEVLKVLLPSTSPLNSVIDMPCNAVAGSTALYMATLYGWTDSVAFLLKAGSNPNVLDEEGRSSLMYALSANQGATIMALLDHGANPDIVTLDGKHTRSFIGVESTRYLLERFLSEGVKPRQRPVVQYSKVIKPKPPVVAAAAATGATKPPTANAGTSLRDAMKAHYYKRLEEASAAGDERATRAIAMQKAAGIYPSQGEAAYANPSKMPAPAAAAPAHVPRGVETVMMTTSGPDGVKKQVEVEIEEVSMEEMERFAALDREAQRLAAIDAVIDAEYIRGYPQVSKAAQPLQTTPSAPTGSLNAVAVAVEPTKAATAPPSVADGPKWSPAELEWLKTIPPTQNPGHLWYLRQSMGADEFARQIMKSDGVEKNKQPTPGQETPAPATESISVDDGPEWTPAESEWLKTLSPPQDASMLWALKRNISPSEFARVMNSNVFTKAASVGVAVPAAVAPDVSPLAATSRGATQMDTLANAQGPTVGNVKPRQPCSLCGKIHA